MEKIENNGTKYTSKDQNDLSEKYCKLIVGDFEFTEEEAEKFANKIEIGVDLEQHRSLLVRKTAYMIPDISGKRAIDIGTGEGRWARYMASKGATAVVGIDKCSKMITIAEERKKPNDSLYFYNEDLRNLEKNDFDFANAFLVSNYIKDLDNFFHQITNILCCDGKFLFTTKTIELSKEDKNHYKNLLLPISGHNGHKIYSFPHSTNDYVEAMKLNNLEIVSSQINLTQDVFSNEILNLLEYTINDLIILCKKN